MNHEMSKPLASMLHIHRLPRLLLAVTVVALLAACGNDTAPEEAPDVTAEIETPAPVEEPAVTEPEAEPETPVNGEPVAYQVECDPDGRCRVDAETFIGWRMYNTNCLACHGPAARGSSMAPNLMTRLNTTVDYDRYVKVMTEGYTGPMGAMPSFARNPAVMERLPSIYQYLRARADGALGEGRPERM